ncbi:MAG: (d)CMP kinase, partial [Pseudomonadota bacterium]
MGTAPFTVAIDGPAAAGKGTIGRAIAQRFDLAHLDTGLLYRAVGAEVLGGADPVAAARNLEAGALENPDLRTAAVAQEASKVAVIPEVRAALLDFQRAFARRAGGAVLDGRDICTVICPQAEVKMFVTATPEVRAQRRYEELIARGQDATFTTVLADVEQRDRRDSERSAA